MMVEIVCFPALNHNDPNHHIIMMKKDFTKLFFVKSYIDKKVSALQETANYNFRYKINN